MTKAVWATGWHRPKPDPNNILPSCSGLYGLVTFWFLCIPFQNLKFCNLIQSRDASLCEVCASQADQRLNPVPSERGLVHFGPSSRIHRRPSVLCWFSLRERF